MDLSQLSAILDQAIRLTESFFFDNIWLALYTIEQTMKAAKLFRIGQHQAVRLPEEFHFDGTQVYVKQMGNALLLLPEQDSWHILIESLGRFSDDFMEVRDQPEQQVREAPSE